MPVELRKRKAPEAAVVSAPPPKKKSAVSKVTEKVKEAFSPKPKATNGAATSTSSGKVAVGDTIALETFGGEVVLNDGQPTTLQKLVDASAGGVVLFTYPKASTPGCTKQACLFRDSYVPLTATGFAIYGLSADSPTSNTTFQTKQKLPYPLLCDPKQTLISAIGMKKPPKSTSRGVFVVDKSGKVLAAEAGSPDGTVAVVKRLVESSGSTTAPAATAETAPVAAVANGDATKEDVDKANVAAEVADTAEKLDSNEAKPVVPTA